MSDAVRSQTTAQYHAASVLAYGLGQRLSSIVWQQINHPEDIKPRHMAMQEWKESFEMLVRLGDLADLVGDVPVPDHTKALVLETRWMGERLLSELEAQEGER